MPAENTRERARGGLNSARAGSLSGLQTGYGAERGSVERCVGRRVVRMIKEICGLRANLEADLFFDGDGLHQRHRDRLRSRAGRDTDAGRGESPHIVWRNSVSRGIEPFVDALIPVVREVSICAREIDDERLLPEE